MNTEKLIERIIELAFDEDGADVTSGSIFESGECIDAVIKAKENGIIAGMELARKAFAFLNPATEMTILVEDGSKVSPGEIVARVHGPAVDVLRAERVALNFMQRMSGIATVTSKYVELTEGTNAKILDTRKTCPGHRVLDKMAVRLGGGKNHRMGLYDMALIKDNHIDRAGSIPDAVIRVRLKNPGIPIEVEARSLDDVKVLLGLDVDRIMLDNFDAAQMKEAVALVAGAIPLEASGNVTLERVREVAESGVDFISVGDLTHSVRSLDISMIIEV